MLPRGGLNVRQVQLRKIMIGSWLEGCGRGRPRRCVCMLRVEVAQADGSGRSQAGAEHGGRRGQVAGSGIDAQTPEIAFLHTLSS